MRSCVFNYAAKFRFQAREPWLIFGNEISTRRDDSLITYFVFISTITFNVQLQFSKQVRTKMLRKYFIPKMKDGKDLNERPFLEVSVSISRRLSFCIRVRYSCRCASDPMILHFVRFSRNHIFLSIYRESIRIFGMPRFKFVFESDLIVIGSVPGE